MSLLELFLLAVGLSMDAFAVSVCKGLSVRRGSMKQALTVGIWFGGFQALMPFLGYLLGITFSSLITSIDHWIAFVLLAFIGFNMIREARSDEENESNDRFDFKTMLPLAVATSIDALAVGVTFAFLRVNIVPAVSFIGCITFLLRNRFKGRQHHRRKKPLPRRICGRSCPDPDGHKDSAGTPRRDFVLKAFV